MNDLQLKIKSEAEKMGAAITGFSCVADAHKPGSYLSRFPYAFTIAIRLSDAIIDEINTAPTYTYFKHYRSVNALLDEITLKISGMIEADGNRAFPVPASQSIPSNSTTDSTYEGIFQHKTAAVLAGLGYIGKSGLFISYEHGPRVRLATVLTDFRFDVNGANAEGLHNKKGDSDGSHTEGEYIEERYAKVEDAESGLNEIEAHRKTACECGKCRICADACPAVAITGATPYPGMQRSAVLDARACSKYMNKHFKDIARGSVCGICMRVCPKGQRS